MSAIEQREDWLLQRQKGIGGTDIAAILGIHPYKSAIDVYLGKLGLSEPVDITDAMWWGNYLEAGVAQKYSDETGFKVLRGEAVASVFNPERCGVFNGQTLVHHPELAYFLGTPDGVVVPNGNYDRGLEIKTAGFKSEEWGKPGTDEVPAHYLLQCAWYMLVTGIDVWDLAVLFHGNESAIYQIRRNPELEQQMIEAGRAFWNDNILKEVPPAVDSSESYGRYLARKFSIGSADLVPETPEITQWAERLREAQKIGKQAELDECLAKNNLAALIADAGGCKTSLGKVGWVRAKNKSFTTDYATAFAELSALAIRLLPDIGRDVEQIKAQFTTEKMITPYVRAWFTKEAK